MNQEKLSVAESYLDSKVLQSNNLEEVNIALCSQVALDEGEINVNE